MTRSFQYGVAITWGTLAPKKDRADGHLRQTGTASSFLSRILQLNKPSMTDSLRKDDGKIDLSDELWKSRSRYDSLFEQASDPIMITDRNGIFLDVNQTLCKLFGYEKEELIGADVSRLMDPSELDRDPLRFDLLVKGQSILRERRMRHRSGRIIEVEANVNMLPEGSILAIARDITERKLSGEKLRKSEHDFQMLIEQASDGIFISIPGGNILDVNTCGCTLTGFTHKELLGMRIGDLFLPEELVKNPLKYDEIRKGHSVLTERRLKTMSGNILHVETNSNLISDGRVLSIMRNITERKNVEKILRDSENRFKNIVEKAPVAIGCYDEDLDVTIINQKFTEITGYTPNEIPTADIFRSLVFKDPTYREHVFNEWSVNKVDRIEVQIETKSGEFKTVEAARAISGDLTFVVAADITERKKSEELLRKSEQDFRMLIEQASDWIFITDLQGSFLEANLVTCKNLGYERQELLRMKITDLFLDRDPAIEPLHLQQLIEGKTLLTERVLKKAEGIPIEVEVSSKLISDGRVLGIARDITERKRADRTLRRAFDRINFHINNTPLGVIEWDSQFRVTQWSKRAEEIFGWNAEEALGKAMNDYIVHEDDVEKVKKSQKTLLIGKIVDNPSKTRNYTREGKVLYCEWYNSLLKDEHGKVETILSLVRDVTEIREAEVEIINSEEKYRQMFYKSPYPAWIFDMDTLRILEVNQAATQKYGYEKIEFSGLSVRDLVAEQEFPDVMGFISLRRNLSRSQKKLWSHRKKNGDVMLVEMAFYPIEYFGKKAMQVQINDMTEKMRLEKKLEQQQKLRQKHITEAVLRTQENERSELGKELHDNINQMLAASKMFLGIALNRDEPKRDFLVKSRENIAMAIEEIRKLSKTLITPHLKEIGLKESIKELVTDFLLLNKIKVQVDTRKLDENILSREQKIAIYRIIQEQLNNISKYAHASTVEIRLKNEDGRILLEIADNGKGFDTKARRKGVGITNIISRAELYNGDVHIDSEPGKGCKMEIVLNVKVPVL